MSRKGGKESVKEKEGARKMEGTERLEMHDAKPTALNIPIGKPNNISHRGVWVDKSWQNAHLVSMCVSGAGLVDLGLVLDVSSTVGVLEAVQGLLQVGISNGHASNHEGAAVATQ